MAETHAPTYEDTEVSDELTEDEKHDVHTRVRPRAIVVLETIRAEGELELRRPTSALAWSGLAAGLSMGFSLVTMGALRAALPDTSWRSLLVKLGYPVGFVIIILGRQQLFTENTLTPVLPLLHDRTGKTLKNVVRLWTTVLLANLVGAFLFALAIGRSAVLSPEIKSQLAEISRAAIAGGFGDQFVRAIFSGWLIALVVWLLPNAESAKVFVIILLTYIIGIGDLSHVVAGSVEAFYAVVTGAVTLPHALASFTLPVLLGNLVGGGALVGALHHAQIEADKVSS